MTDAIKLAQTLEDALRTALDSAERLVDIGINARPFEHKIRTQLAAVTNFRKRLIDFRSRVDDRIDGGES